MIIQFYETMIVSADIVTVGQTGVVIDDVFVSADDIIDCELKSAGTIEVVLKRRAYLAVMTTGTLCSSRSL